MAAMDNQGNMSFHVADNSGYLDLMKLLARPLHLYSLLEIMHVTPPSWIMKNLMFLDSSVWEAWKDTEIMNFSITSAVSKSSGDVVNYSKNEHTGFQLANLGSVNLEFCYMLMPVKLTDINIKMLLALLWYHQAQATFSNVKSFVRWLVSPRGMFSCRVQTTTHVVAFHLKYIGKCLQPKSLTWDICLD